MELVQPIKDRTKILELKREQSRFIVKSGSTRQDSKSECNTVRRWWQSKDRNYMRTAQTLVAFGLKHWRYIPACRIVRYYRLT